MKSGVITKQALSTQAKLVNIISSSLFVLDFEDNKTNVTVLSLNSEGLKINLPENGGEGKTYVCPFCQRYPDKQTKWCHEKFVLLQMKIGSIIKPSDSCNINSECQMVSVLRCQTMGGSQHKHGRCVFLLTAASVDRARDTVCTSWRGGMTLDWKAFHHVTIKTQLNPTSSPGTD